MVFFSLAAALVSDRAMPWPCCTGWCSAAAHASALLSISLSHHPARGCRPWLPAPTIVGRSSPASIFPLDFTYVIYTCMVIYAGLLVHMCILFFLFLYLFVFLFFSLFSSNCSFFIHFSVFVVCIFCRACCYFYFFVRSVVVVLFKISICIWGLWSYAWITAQYLELVHTAFFECNIDFINPSSQPNQDTQWCYFFQR